MTVPFRNLPQITVLSLHGKRHEHGASVKMPIDGSFRSESSLSNIALPANNGQPDVVRARREALKKLTAMLCHDIVTACRIASLKPWSCIKLKEFVTEGS